MPYLIEALIAFVLAVLFAEVFHGPAWLLRLFSYGGPTMMILLLILVVEWLVGRVRKAP